MTFAEADKRLTGIRYQTLREHQFSPLHVQPILEGKHVGYRHISEEHSEEGKWVQDLVSSTGNVRVAGEALRILAGTPWQTLDRDCCMLLQNLFFAGGQGIEFDAVALEILREAQRDKSGIDAYAVFGRSANDSANGLRGTWLEISDDDHNDLASRFISWLIGRKGTVVQVSRDDKKLVAKAHCT
jgi:hypothetical protein